jgi:Reverse transcriptase (RNA-dependent DNA polymerase)
MTTRSQTNSLRPKCFPQHELYSATKYPLPSSDLEIEPTCYTQAIKSPHWRQVMACELDALAKSGTWKLVDPPSDSNIIGCKWLFRIKRRADGTIERFKARLVAKEYTQEEGLDYFKTFSPVVKPTIIKSILIIALAHDWHIHQLDVNNAFLHGELKKIIFM